MCGRFSLAQSAESIAETFQLSAVPEWQPRYNIAPTQTIPAIVQTLEQQDRTFKTLRWGLIPSWAKDESIGSKLINARAETIAEKPAFRDAFRRRRCLILADGFYEWKTQSGQKQPFYFQLESHRPFAFAGLCEQRGAAGGALLETCTIITTDANQSSATIHHRMPVILDPDEYDRWLDPRVTQTDELRSLLDPYSGNLKIYPVDRAVNSPTHDAPDCIQQVA
ncbi:MAG: SOS response-associated peptidase [Myxacorys californica WJT36-NPBG1]|jgi:putative SOS response-associated peptidase YedK|nr:SOS response-associated peptidase [Myxacorys californica WJT36-NPBG1]